MQESSNMYVNFYLTLRGDVWCEISIKVELLFGILKAFRHEAEKLSMAGGSQSFLDSRGCIWEEN